MIEKVQKSGDITASINYLEKGNEIKDKANYLDKSDNYQIRELYSYNGEKITAEEGLQQAKNFKHYDIRIYNQVSDNLSKNDLHNMARDIIDARNKQSGGKITGIYAIHQRPDGTNKHLHIVFLTNDKKALINTGRGNEWQKIRTKIELKYTTNPKEKEKVIEYYNKALTTLKSRLTGTEKIDKFILTHMNKKNGNFGLRRALISIQKSKSIKNKEYYIKRLQGRLNSLEKQGIIKKTSDYTYKIDIEKFNKMIEERAKNKIEKNKLQILKEKLYEIKTNKNELKQEIKTYFNEIKKSNSNLDKIFHLYELENSISSLNKIFKEEYLSKLELLDTRLSIFGKINLEKEKEYLKSNTNLNEQQIDNILKTKYNRLEQLEKKGLIEKQNNEYIIKDKAQFEKYIQSSEAKLDREQLLPNNDYEFFLSFKKQINLKITNNSLNTKKDNLYMENKNLFNQLKIKRKEEKIEIIEEIKKINNQINKLSVLEKINKIEILDYKLLSYNKINLEKEKEYLKSNTNLNENQINNILKFKIERMEQLVKKGYLEKKNDEYILKDKDKFNDYLQSNQATQDRIELANKIVSQSQYIDYLEKDNQLKIEMEHIRIKKKKLETKNNFIYKTYTETGKKTLIQELHNNLNKIHQLNLEENNLKIQMLDNKLYYLNKINLEKEKEYLKSNTNLNEQQIEKIFQIKYDRLEQLKEKGLIEKKGNEYIVKDKSQFSEYIKSEISKNDINELSKKHTIDLDILTKKANLQLQLLDTKSQLNKKYEFLKKNKQFNIKPDEINNLKLEETKTKLEILDNKLLEKGKINPFQGAEYLLRKTKLSTQKIREITEFQIKRLEQLKRRGLVEKKGNEYIVKDKRKFKEYLKSKKASEDRTRLAKSNTTNKTTKSKINNFINRNTKFRPVKDTKSAYYKLSKVFGKSIGDRVIAFALAVGYSVTANSVKLAIRTTYSIIKTFSKNTHKAIHKVKDKKFERKLNKEKNDKYFEKNKHLTSINNNKEKYNDKFLAEIEKNKNEGKIDKNMLNKEKENDFKHKK